MKRIITAAIVLASLVALPVSAFALSSEPTLNWTTAAGYPAAAEGLNWLPSKPVVFSLSQNGRVFGMELRATKAGRFEIGLKRFQCNWGATIQARDLAGSSAVGPVLDPCGPATTYAAPQLVVLKGRKLTPKVTQRANAGNGKTTTITRGDALYLWEKGITSPAYQPTAPTTLFGLMSQGKAPAPCGAKSCTPGFYWEWIGLKVGRTDISLQPWCDGHECPDQYVIALPVDIVARTP